MSLEAIIQDNTNAIRELIAAIKSGVPTTAAQVAAVVTEAKADKPAETTAKKSTNVKKEESAPTQPTAEAGADAAPESKPEPSAQDEAPAPTYQSTADAVTKLAREKGRDAAIGVLAKFGAAKLPDVKPEQFAAVIAECEAVGA